MQQKIRIATRKSPLAMWQAEHVKLLLLQRYPNLMVEIIAMTTAGDRQLETSLAQKGGKGMFIKELENTLYEGRADIAVHSMKDMTVKLPDNLGIAAVLPRENPSDVFIANHYNDLDDVPAGMAIGTSSLRRQAFIQYLRPDLKVKLLRGNVNTRLAKLDNDEYAGIILAHAGMARLGMLARVRQTFSPEVILPAIGQGIIGIECHLHNTQAWALVASLNDKQTEHCLAAERAMNLALEGGCQLPVAGYAIIENDQIWLRGIVATPDGQCFLTASQQGTTQHSEQLGFDVAKQLIAQGAAEIIARIKHG